MSGVGDRSYERHRSDRHDSKSGSSRVSYHSGPSSAGGYSNVKDEGTIEETAGMPMSKSSLESYGYKSDNYDKMAAAGAVKQEVKPEPRDIDMRVRRRESESYSPTRPDYKPTIKTEVFTGGEALPSVVEELASMVAVSGEDLEDIARDRNKSTPELRFLFERTGHLYKKYRARVAELKQSFQDTKKEVKSEREDTQAQTLTKEPTRKRKSRWGGPSEAQPAATLSMPGVVGLPPPGLINIPPPGMASNIPPPGLAHLQPNRGSIGAPGVAIPTQLGGMVQKIEQPAQPSLQDIKQGNPSLAAYAVKVFGTTSLTDMQWKQCEDQMKMSVVYGQLAAKQAAAKVKAASGKRQYEYDSDEDTEGGTWEHKARQAEMEKTYMEASKLTNAAEAVGKHHIGDFLPPEELSKFMNKYKAMRTGTAWDKSEYQENKLTQSNVGFKMLQKMGWSEGAGLGSDGHGITAPVGKSGNVAERAGLGMGRPGEVDEEDDEFETYRKRMMLAYRFRPNPLNNPRRSYY